MKNARPGPTILTNCERRKGNAQDRGRRGLACGSWRQAYAINFFLAFARRNQGSRRHSEGGSEDASLYVYNAASGAQIAGPIDRAQFGTTAWSEDARTLYFVRLKKLKAGDRADRKISGRDARCVGLEIRSPSRPWGLP